MSGWDGLYPVDERGNALEYVAYGEANVGGWRLAEEFEASLLATRLERGRSSLRLLCVDESGAPWSVYGTELLPFIHSAHEGRVRGRWIMKKRGGNYGLVLVEALEAL